MAERVLDDRALNRALLARQGLLERREVPVTTMLEQLAGVQAEQPQYPYIGLWSRIRGFDPAELGAALTDRTAVRLWVMRGTIHLTTPQTRWPCTRSPAGCTGSRSPATSARAWPARTRTRSPPPRWS